MEGILLSALQVAAFVVVFAVQVTIAVIEWGWNHLTELLIAAWGLGMWAMVADIKYECRQTSQRLRALSGKMS